MENLFIPYKLAKKLKQKGFDEPCFCVYNNDGKLIMVSNWEDCNDWSFDFCRNSKYSPSDRTSAPTYQQVTDWFREEHNINIEVMTTGEDNKYPKWNYWLVNTKKSNRVELAMQELKEENPIEYSTYYQALTKGIEEALKLI